jgi:hypothetical protein
VGQQVYGVHRARKGTIEAIVVAPAAIGELSFVAHLLIKGVRVREEERLPLASVAS